MPAFVVTVNQTYSRTNLLSSSSSDTPFVSGTFVNTQISWRTIMNARNANMGHGVLSPLNTPVCLSKKTGVINVMIAANTQCVLAPNDWPNALTLLGNTSDIKTQI